MTPTRPPLLPLDEATERLLSHARPLTETESVSTLSVFGSFMCS